MYALNTFSPLLVTAFTVTIFLAIASSVAIAFFGTLKARLYNQTLSNKELEQWHLSNHGKLSQPRHHKTFTAIHQKSSARNCRALIARHSETMPTSETIYCNLNHILQLTQAENAKQASQSPCPSLGMNSTQSSTFARPCNLPPIWRNKFQSQIAITLTPSRARQTAANLTQARYATQSITLAVYMTKTDRTEPQPSEYLSGKPTAQTRARVYRTQIRSFSRCYGNEGSCRPIVPSHCDFLIKTANYSTTPTRSETLPSYENCKPQATTPIIFAPLLTASLTTTGNEQWTKSERNTLAMKATKATPARRLATIQRRAQASQARRAQRLHYQNRLNQIATMDSELHELLAILR